MNKLPLDFTVIDFETTGLSCDNDEIIELAAIKYRDGKAVGEINHLVRPVYPICSRITDITGITNEMLHDAPSISSVIDEFVDFIGQDVIVGHNVQFDIRFLCANADLCDWDFQSVDTLKLARKLILGLPNYKLETLKEVLNINPDVPSHRALNDCRVTGEIYLFLCGLNEHNKQEIERPKRKTEKKERLEIICQLSPDDVDKSNPLYGKYIAITGAFESGTRDEIYQKIVNLGGIISPSVNQHTDYLFVGSDNFESTKCKKAQQLINSGKSSIKILSENDFIMMHSLLHKNQKRLDSEKEKLLEEISKLKTMIKDFSLHNGKPFTREFLNNAVGEGSKIKIELL